MNVVILASHEGTTLQAVLDADRALSSSVVLIISNNSTSGALRRARVAGVPAVHLSASTHPDPGALDSAILDALRTVKADLVLLAGYMKKLGPRVVQEYRGRVIHVHPSLLPKFGGTGMFGRRVYEAVLASGDTETGASVHFVETDYDVGQVVAQCRVPVNAGDTVETLAARVQESERLLVVRTLERFSNDSIWCRANG